RVYPLGQFQPSSKSAQLRDGVYALPDGELTVTHTFDRDGTYTFRFSAAGVSSDKEPARIAIRVDGADLYTANLQPVGEFKPGTFREVNLKVKGGTRRVAIGIANP